MIGAKSLGQLMVHIGADTGQLSRGIGNAKGEVTMFGKHSTVTMQGVGKAALAMGAAVVLALGLITMASAKVGMEFEQSVTNAAAIAGAGLKEFETEARRIGRTTQFTASQAADAMYSFASAGWGVKGTMEATAPAVDLAIGTMSDMTTTAELLATSVKAMGEDFKEARRYADVYAEAIKSSMLTTTKLREAMKYAAPTGRALGWSIEQTTAAVSLFANLGLEGSQAGTNLRMAMIQLGKGGDNAKGALQRLGLTLEDVNPQTHDFGEIVQVLADEDLVKLKDAVDIFGARAGAAMLSIIKTAREQGNEFDVLLDKYEKAQGAAEQLRKIMQDTAGGQFKRFQSAVEAIGLAIWDLIKGPLKEFFSTMADIASSIAIWIEQNKALVIIIGIVTASLGAMLLAFGAIVVIGPVVVAVIAAIGTATLGTALIIGGIVAVLAAVVVALGAFAIAWETNMGHIQEYTMGTVFEIQKYFTNLWHTIYYGFTRFTTSFLAAGNSLWSSAATSWSTGLSSLADAFKQFISGIKGGLKNMGEAISLMFEGNFEEAGEKAREAWNSVSTNIKAGYADVKAAIPDIGMAWNDATTAGGDAYAALTKEMEGLKTETNAYYGELQDLVANAIQGDEEQISVLEELKKKYESVLDDLTIDDDDTTGGGDKKDPYKNQIEAAKNLAAEIKSLNAEMISEEEKKYTELKGKLNEYLALAQETGDARIMDQERYNEALLELDKWRIDSLKENIEALNEYQLEKDFEKYDNQLMLLEEYWEQYRDTDLANRVEYENMVAEIEEARNERVAESLYNTIDQYAAFYGAVAGVIEAGGNKQLATTIKTVSAYIGALSKMFIFFGTGEAMKNWITFKSEGVQAMAALARQDYVSAALHGAASGEAISAYTDILGSLASLPQARDGAVIMAHPNEAVVPFNKMGEAFRMWKGAGGDTINDEGDVTVNNYIGDINSVTDKDALLEDIGESIQSALGRA